MVAMYCSPEHQAADEKEHQMKCGSVHECRLDYLLVRRKIIEQSGTGQHVFVRFNGRTYPTYVKWISEYHDAVMRFKAAVAKVRTKQAIECEVNLIKHWYAAVGLRECNALFARTSLLFIRLNRDDECPDLFMNGLDCIDVDLHGHTFLPEDEYCIIGNTARLIHILLRVRVAVDLRSLQMTAKAVGEKFPKEIFNQICQSVVCSPFVQNNCHVLESDSHNMVITRLDEGIQEMALALHRKSGDFWRLMFPEQLSEKLLPIHPEKNLDSLLEGHIGSTKEALEDLRQAWLDSPGAVDYFLPLLLNGIVQADN